MNLLVKLSLLVGLQLLVLKLLLLLEKLQLVVILYTVRGSVVDIHTNWRSESHNASTWD